MQNDFGSIKAELDEHIKVLHGWKAENDARLDKLAADKIDDSAMNVKMDAMLADFHKGIDEVRAEIHKGEEALLQRLELSGARIGRDGEARMPTQADYELDAAVTVDLTTGSGGYSCDGRLTAAEVRELAEHDYVGAYIRGELGDQQQGITSPSAAFTKLLDRSGGIFVEPTRQRAVLRRLRDTTPMRRVARVQTISRSDALTGRLRWGTFGASYVGEEESAGETTTPDYKKWRIPVHRQEAIPQISGEWFDDAEINVTQELNDGLIEDFSINDNTKFVTGSGAGEPEGFLSGATAATADATRAYGTLEHVVTGVSADFAASNKFDVFIDLIAKLKPGYRQGSVWMMSRGTMAAVMKIKQNSEYLWSMNDVQRSPWTFAILGYDVVEAEDVPAIAADSLSIAYGNFRRGFMIVDRLGMRILRDPYTAQPMIKFVTTKRTGSGLIDSEAIKVIKFSA